MILDSSAVIATIMGEPMARALGNAIGAAPACRIGAPTLVETTLVLVHKEGPHGKALLADFLQQRRFDVISFGDAHWRAAQMAFVRFGKGRHPAGLNFGDCLTYATAFVAGEPLLCVGDDFPQTDLELVKLEL
ncbi:ribonuclease VapC [Amycolatopsis lexingtonensis]|uniref:Ribonuclease VapC n=1 Tax=Amycolatopsis lexingtonensis TaxID=218822 RepID=A0ABR9IHR6_9PSEU|nr:type II toxin-antitoxin system VapC family toxin [Amycolatopsis lexingtonensis]MBE1502731.1 ribonuclease VapC [Amycolatopsis lexingtonensis]